MADLAPKVIALEHTELAGLPVIDGVPTAANDNVLVAGQDDPDRNGIYRVSATGWLRRPDFDAPADMTPGTSFYVCQGPHKGSVWLYEAEARPAQVNVTPLRFRKYLDGAYPWGGVPPKTTQYGHFFRVGLNIGWGGDNRVVISEGYLWIPGSPNIVEAPVPLEAARYDLEPYRNYWVYFFEGADGLLDAELSETIRRPFTLYLKPGDHTRRLARNAPIVTDKDGRIKPSAAV